MVKEQIWDVIVVGGGPAGMMSAGVAGSNGAKVLLIEKNANLGEKLLITGGGRCNLTNAEFDNRKFLSKMKNDRKFLFSAFSQFGVKDTLDFFHNKGLDTKIENELRVFPTSEKAEDVFKVLIKYMKDNGVEVLSNSPVADIVKEKDKIVGVRLENNKTILGKSIIIATGGTSHPETGSTGDAFKWLADIGHEIIKPSASLVPVAIKDLWVKKLAGLTLTEIKISLFQNGKKDSSKKGKLLFTHFGVSGPTILNMSRDVGELLKYGEVIISLDLLPKQDYGVLNQTLQDLFAKNNKKKLVNALSNLIPSALAQTIVDLSKIEKDKKCHSITREERLNLVQLLKNIPLRVDKLLGVEKSIVSSGGVALDEVDFKTMRSRLYPNLYLIGDVLNIDRPSGGYSLQLCWTTGFVAGRWSNRK